MSYNNPPYYLTAYGLAVKQGFKGSLDEWLISLIGPPGPAGKSAYEYARDGGYTGTEAEFTMQMARELNAVQVTESMTSHMASKENPHSVTAAQIGAAESGHSHKTMDDHVASKENPHNVTHAQIGAAAAQHSHGAAEITRICVDSVDMDTVLTECRCYGSTMINAAESGRSLFDVKAYPGGGTVQTQERILDDGSLRIHVRAHSGTAWTAWKRIMTNPLDADMLGAEVPENGVENQVFFLEVGQ